jgi:hypothetical protein
MAEYEKRSVISSLKMAVLSVVMEKETMIFGIAQSQTAM